MNNPLYCPRCGDVLTESADDELHYVRGRMDLSRNLEQRLRACYVTQTRSLREFLYALIELHPHDAV